MFRDDKSQMSKISKKTSSKRRKKRNAHTADLDSSGEDSPGPKIGSDNEEVKDDVNALKQVVNEGFTDASAEYGAISRPVPPVMLKKETTFATSMDSDEYTAEGTNKKRSSYTKAAYESNLRGLPRDNSSIIDEVGSVQASESYASTTLFNG